MYTKGLDVMEGSLGGKREWDVCRQNLMCSSVEKQLKKGSYISTEAEGRTCVKKDRAGYMCAHDFIEI